MKALAEQIDELDGVEVYGRVVGVRGLMVEVAGPIHAMSVGARLTHRDRRRTRASRARWSASPAAMRWRCRSPRSKACGAAAARWCRRAAGAVRPSERLARPRRQRHGRADRRQGPAAVRDRRPIRSAPRRRRRMRAAGRRAARSRRARAQHLPHLLPRPAHGHLLRLRRRQVGAAVDAGAQRRRRCLGDRPGRRTRPRGAGVLAGRSRPGRPCALGGGGLDLRRAGADAPPGRLSDARHRRISSATSARTCWC